MAKSVLVRPAGTSWMSVFGGWIATIGAMALIAPAVAGILARADVAPGDVVPAVPVVVGIFISYLVGGYVAGRMAGYRTSWHGMMTAFFSLFVLLIVALLGYAADRGVFAGSGISSLSDVVPGYRELSADRVGNALTFGALIGFLAAIFAGWLGGVLAPAHAAVPVASPYATPAAARPAPLGRDRVVRQEVVRERRPLIPSLGRKGGERVVERRDEEIERS